MTHATTRTTMLIDAGEAHLSAWLYRASVSGPAPCVVMAHGLAGTKALRLDAYAERFAAAGFHTLVFDYRHFGSSGGSPRQLVSISRQHQDWRSAVRFARGLKEVDADRVALWGTSLSGGHVLAVAAQVNPAAVISQVPHVDGLASVRTQALGQVAKMLAVAVADQLGALVGRSPVYLPAAGPPGAMALMTRPEAMDYHDIVPASVDWDDRVAARFVLEIGLYSPGKALRALKVPVLVQVGTRDETTPPQPAIEAAATCATATLITYDTGHFSGYVGEWFERFVADQVVFLRSHLS